MIESQGDQGYTNKHSRHLSGARSGRDDHTDVNTSMIKSYQLVNIKAQLKCNIFYFILEPAKVSLYDGKHEENPRAVVTILVTNADNVTI